MKTPWEREGRPEKEQAKKIGQLKKKKSKILLNT